MITGDIPITITNEIWNFKDLYALHKKGKYCISSKLTLTYEMLDYLNALLQFDRNERINMEDIIQHPFLKKNFEEQKSVLISSLVNGEGIEL